MKEESSRLQAEECQSDKYYRYQVIQYKDGIDVHDVYFGEDQTGIYLVPDEPRFIGDVGEYMGDTFEEAKVNIAEFVNNLMK